MFIVDADDEILTRLRKLLEEEDEGTCVRLRAYKTGCG